MAPGDGDENKAGWIFSAMMWTMWVMALIGGSALLLDQDLRLYLGFVCGTFCGAALLPPAGNTAAPYFVHLAIPFLSVKGLQEGGVWTIMNVLFVFLLMPVADAMTGAEKFRRHDEAEIKHLRDTVVFRWATWLMLPAELALLTYACHAMNSTDRTALELAGFIISVGMYTGGMGDAVSHELQHKTNRFEQRIGGGILAAAGCGHLMIEHNRGHHKLIATDEDSASARYGECFFTFVARNIRGTFLGAWNFEKDRCRDRNLPPWHNEIFRYWAVGSVMWTALTVAFGPKSLLVLAGVNAMGQALFAATNFLEHYALERHADEDGCMEAVSHDHSWDTEHRMTNVVLFNIARHGDHHMHSTRRYQELGLEKPSEGPQLPAGYPACILMAIFPPLWRAVMHPRVHSLRRKYEGRTWRHGPSTSPKSTNS